MNITVVTVTYGGRWALLEQTVRAAFDAGADYAIVIDNDSTEPIAERMSERFPGKCTTLRQESNSGSAGGYCEGIKVALDMGVELLLLLDDDNVVHLDAVRILKETYDRLGDTCPRDRLCVAAVRMEQEMLRDPVKVPDFPDRHAFLGFHVRDIPRGIFKRISGKRRAKRQANGQSFIDGGPRRIAPWGGLFFHRSLIERFGYPDWRFVVYHDDTEFTHRVTSGGGLIWLEPAAQVEDIDPSWQSKRDRDLYFAAWIKRGSNEKAYYQTRNCAFLETHGHSRSWMREINRAALLPVLWGIALRSRKLDRFRLLLKAVRDGESGNLGKAQI